MYNQVIKYLNKFPLDEVTNRSASQDVSATQERRRHLADDDDGGS
jgi:hypothetical protein